MSTDLVLLEELEFDGDVGAQLVVLLLVRRVLALRLVQLWRRVGVARAELQRLHVVPVGVELDPTK